MIFGPSHYVPILKAKRGEKKALANISSALRQHITPLLEIVERRPVDGLPTISQHLTTAFRDLASSVQGYARCLIDLREIAPDGPSAADEAFKRASDASITFTPVTGISRTADVAAAVAYSNGMGIAVRLTREEYESGNLATRLNAFLSKNSLNPNDVDLIVDIGPVEDLVTAGVMSLTQGFLADVPDKNLWRTLTVTGSAFPKSMAAVGRNSSTRVKRTEWLAWRDGLFARQGNLERLPTFSDCAIQHPAGVEGFDYRYMQASATIRYTSGDYWLLVKGEGMKTNPATAQFPRLATHLVYGQLLRDFMGVGHCVGCQMAKDSADGAPNLGSPEVWRRLGTIHHITAVVQDDLASLQWP